LLVYSRELARMQWLGLLSKNVTARQHQQNS
jgi:hypothetical protein